MGEYINAMFEAQMLWSFDNGLIYFTGRDIVACIIGVLIGIVLTLMFVLLEMEDKRK